MEAILRGCDSRKPQRGRREWEKKGNPVKSVLWSKLLLKTTEFQPWWGVSVEHTSELSHLRGMEAAALMYQLFYTSIAQHKDERSQRSHSCCSGMLWLVHGDSWGNTSGAPMAWLRDSSTMAKRKRVSSPEAKFCGLYLLKPSFVALEEKKTWEILGSYKKGRRASTWDGHFPRYRICRGLIIGVENVVTAHGVSWHGLPGVVNCLWM